MSENSGAILTGLFLHGEAQRKAQDAKYDADKKSRELQETNRELEESQEKISNLNNELEDEVALLQRHQNSLLEDFAIERDYRNKVVRMHNELLDENATLKEENEHYKKLLCKPMAEIAASN